MENWNKVAKQNKIKNSVYWSRVNKLGWSPEKAATLPVGIRKKRLDLEWLQKAKANGISSKAYRERVDKLKWTPEKASSTPLRILETRKDQEWVELAKQNGISYDTFIKRVDRDFWDPEEAATTPIKSIEECIKSAHKSLEEFNQIRHQRINKDKNNLFKLTPQHIETAKQNGIKKGTVHSRIYIYGWTIQDAITVPPIKRTKRSEEYYLFLQLAKENNILNETFLKRVNIGWSYKDAATLPSIERKKRNKRRRADKAFIEQAIKNNINYETYLARVDKRGWTPEEASTIAPLKNGEFLNEQQREKSLDGFKKFKKM